MKKLIFLWVLFCLPLLILKGQAHYNVITYNIRLNTPGDGIHAWPHRKADVINLLRFHQADIFCMQEALDDQVADIRNAFPDFGFEGVGRDDGVRAGEYSPVFYRLSRFRKIDAGHFWLSESPDKPSLGWDAACIRICTWVKLEDKVNHRVFFVFCTHFDHVGVEARKHAADLILERITKLAGDQPVILCGDFNLPPDAEPIQKIRERLRDSYDVTELPPFGSVGTFRGFTFDDPIGSRIDYIFVTDGIRVLRYGALTDARERSFFSDHLPVLVTVSF